MGEDKPWDPTSVNAQSAGSGTSDYNRRLLECQSTLYALQLRREMFYKSKRWANFSLFVDSSCLLLGSLLFYETCRVANEEISFLREVTGNPFVRRVFTPFPLFSSLLILYGIISLPADIIVRQTVKRYIKHEDQSIKRMQDTIDDIQRAPK